MLGCLVAGFEMGHAPPIKRAHTVRASRIGLNALALCCTTHVTHAAPLRFLRRRYNANRAALVQSRIKALERLAEVEVMEEDPGVRRPL